MRTGTALIPLIVVFMSITIGCGPQVSAGDTANETSTGPNSSSTTGSPPGPSTTNVPSTTVPGTTIGESTGCGTDCDETDTDGRCDIWEQPCPPGEKCAPWANDGGNSWNDTKCVPIDPDPGGAGDPCTAEGSGVSGIDTCDLGLVCFGIDERLVGECEPLCIGSPQEPTCADPSRECQITAEGVLNLCIGTCNPLADECDPDEVCVSSSQRFVCVPDASGPDGQHGDPCEFVNACDPGLACISADFVPGCNGFSGCCSLHCDTSLSPDGQCPGFPQEDCLAWYEDTPPEGLENVGVCAIDPA